MTFTPKINKITSSQRPLAYQFVPSKSGKDSVHIAFILDSSSSMNVVRQETLDGLNKFLDGQRNNDVPTKASLYTFDGIDTSAVFEGKDIETIEPLGLDMYNPNGMTNLNDAIGNVLFQMQNNLNEDPSQNIQIVILTDGQENASQTFSSDTIKEMVEKAGVADWQFTFLGANIDAFAVGSSFGIKASDTMQYTMNNVGQTISLASAKTARTSALYRSENISMASASAMAGFTDEERTEAAGSK